MFGSISAKEGQSSCFHSASQQRQTGLGGTSWVTESSPLPCNCIMGRKTLVCHISPAHAEFLLQQGNTVNNAVAREEEIWQSQKGSIRGCKLLERLAARGRLRCTKWNTAQVVVKDVVLSKTFRGGWHKEKWPAKKDSATSGQHFMKANPQDREV